MAPKVKKVVKKAVARKVAILNVTGDQLNEACRTADNRRTATGLSKSNPNSKGILDQNHAGGYTIGEGKNAQVFTAKGGNNIVDLAKVLDALAATPAGNAEFLSKQFTDGQIIPTRTTVLTSSPAITAAVASTKKQPQKFVTMVAAIEDYLTSEHGAPAPVEKRAKQPAANVLPTRLA